MELLPAENLKKTLSKLRVVPSRRMGQNFLVDEKILEKIIAAGDLSSQDTILEIGAGLGQLTKTLVKKTKAIIAVEKDRKLAAALEKTFKKSKKVKIIKDDILNLITGGKGKSSDFFEKENIKNYKVVANIPYYLTSRLIRNLLENRKPPVLIVLTIQKEVAQRICAKPPRMNLLALSVQFYAQPKIIAAAPKSAFWPIPKVDSAIIKIKTGKQKSKIKTECFFRAIKAGFSHPRKTLANNLSEELGADKKNVLKWLKKCRIENAEKIRAENLSIINWVCLAKEIPYLK